MSGLQEISEVSVGPSSAKSPCRYLATSIYLGLRWGSYSLALGGMNAPYSSYLDPLCLLLSHPDFFRFLKQRPQMGVKPWMRLAGCTGEVVTGCELGVGAHGLRL